MTEYTLTLTWSVSQGGGPDLVKSRRNAAIRCAHRHTVDILSIVRENNGATWVVDGTAANIRSMITEWTGHGHVNVSGGP
jgi:hypothetical protein